MAPVEGLVRLARVVCRERFGACRQPLGRARDVPGLLSGGARLGGCSLARRPHAAVDASARLAGEGRRRPHPGEEADACAAAAGDRKGGRGTAGRRPDAGLPIGGAASAGAFDGATICSAADVAPSVRAAGAVGGVASHFGNAGAFGGTASVCGGSASAFGNAGAFDSKGGSASTCGHTDTFGGTASARAFADQGVAAKAIADQGGARGLGRPRLAGSQCPKSHKLTVV